MSTKQKFVLGYRGLNTSIDDIYTDEEWQKYAENDDLPANTNWHHVTVASEADKEAYIEAQTRWLQAAWTPNQNMDEREDSQKTMEEEQAKMDKLRKEPLS